MELWLNVPFFFHKFSMVPAENDHAAKRAWKDQYEVVVVV